MGRPPRIQFEGASYHVFDRGNRREPIFRGEADYRTFEKILLETMRWSGVWLYDWSQMPNHFHLHVETPEGNLAEFMQRLLARYAKTFNAAQRLVGHVFQGRYGAVLCEQEAHFQEIVRYALGCGGGAVSMKIRRTRNHVDQWPQTRRLLALLAQPETR
jgi:putative transposase